MNAIYGVGVIIVGIISFVVIWIYAIASWGFLIGLAVGWFPALIGGFILGILWPLVIIVILILLYLILFDS